MNKQNLLTQIKIKNDKFNDNLNINKYIYENLLYLDKEQKNLILNKIITNNYTNKIIVEYLLNNINQLSINNIYQFLSKLCIYLNIYHSNITIDEWSIKSINNKYILSGTYDLSFKNNKDFLTIMNKIYNILKNNIMNKNIIYKMYERLHGNLLIINFEID